jgi:DNA modification methylase
MEIQLLRIEELKPYEKNPRKNASAVDIVAKSIQQYGFRFPILLDKNKEIIAGHTRLQAAKKLGLTEVPVIFAEDLTPEQVKGLRIMDNKSSEYAEWNDQLLKEEIESLKLLNFDITYTGLSEKELSRLMNGSDKREDVIPTTAKYEVKLGDIFKLGDHVIMCGDSTKKEEFDKIMQGNKADLVLTDPPYNLNFNGTVGGQFTNMANDNLNEADFQAFIDKVSQNMKDNSKDTASYYVWIDYRHYPTIVAGLKKAGLDIMNCVIWDKVFSGLGYKYRFRHEMCVFAGKRIKVQWYGDGVDEDIITLQSEESPDFPLDMRGFLIETSAGEYIRIKKEKIPTKRVPIIKIGEKMKFSVKSDKNDNIIQSFSMNSFGQRDKEFTEGIEHPTIKPQQILKQFLINSSKDGDIVLDCFAGSHSTLIACEELNRKARCIEIDPKYVSIGIERWENFSGKKHIKIN